MEKLLTVDEVAQVFRISERTIYTWIDEGVIRCVKIKDKSAVRIPLSEVERLVQEALEVPATKLSAQRKKRLLENLKKSLR
jgi:excisionase family DNA binding protein